MKNLMIYVNPHKEVGSSGWELETDQLLKIQIDNSLRLGWKTEDIILVTNFDYTYNGVKAVKVPDEVFCAYKPTVTKIYTIVHMIKNGMMDDSLYWFHDLDAFQLEKITEEEIVKELDGRAIGMTDYGKTVVAEHLDKRWSTGSIFFTKEALDIFEHIKKACDDYQANEEVILLELLKKTWRYPNLKDRIKKINITYNVATRKRDLSGCYEMADKPVRVLHFHPSDDRNVSLEGHNNIDVCLYGKNRMGKVLIPKELLKIFNKHGIS